MEETLAVEHNWARAGEKLAVANMNEKLIEEKERLLQTSIARNYERIRYKLTRTLRQTRGEVPQAQKADLRVSMMLDL